MVDKYILIHYYAFYGVVDKFVELYKNFEDYGENRCYIETLDEESYLMLCMERGCQYYFEFAKYVYESNIQVNDRILKAISNRYIMSNCFDEKLFNKIRPFRIWYPDCPSLEILNFLEKKLFYPVLYTKYMYDIEVKELEVNDYYTERVRRFFLNDNTFCDKKFELKVVDPEWYHNNFNIKKFGRLTDFISEKPLKFYNFFKYIHYGSNFFPSCFPSSSFQGFRPHDFDFEYNESAHEYECIDDGFAYFRCELRFLHNFLNNDDFKLNKNEEIDVNNISKNMQYATLVYNTTDKYNYECLTKFMEVGYVTIEDIIKYDIFNFSTPYLINDRYYSNLMEKLPDKFKHNVYISMISCSVEDCIYEFEADIDIFKSALKANNVKVMKDQMNKAIDQGFFYQHLDMKNKKWNDPPKKIYLKHLFAS